MVGRGVAPVPVPTVPAALLELARSGAAPLTPAPATAPDSLHIAAVIPSFRRGSGGHGTIVNLAKELMRGGHVVSLWLEDFERRHAGEPGAVTLRNFAEFFNAFDLDLRTDFRQWHGADVVLATGWQTVPRVLLLPGAASRAYLVQDHEPEFYGASAQALLAAATYRQGLHCIAASPWLADLLRTRYGASASHFDLAVDQTIYRAAADPRRQDLVVFYARAATPRRAVPLGLLALEELRRRRPDVEIALFGGDSPSYAPFRHTDLGVLGSDALAALYRRATVGMVFSLTNPSLIGLEMMACGLPGIELASEPMLATFGRSGPLELISPDPLELSGALTRLVEDEPERRRRARAGLELMRGRTWSRAAQQVEEAMRHALAGAGPAQANTTG
jgi:glycosyltransferase involved in cell wall biosynthesis